MLFTTATAMIGALMKATAKGLSEEKIKHYTVTRLLIVDEIGYRTIDRQGANLFFNSLAADMGKAPWYSSAIRASVPGERSSGTA